MLGLKREKNKPQTQETVRRHWTIDKRFDFCYGHRVWSQQLNTQYCAEDDSFCKCRFMHGHQGHVHVYLQSNNLDGGMVTDFKHLGWLDDFLDQNLDHKFIIDINDPWFVNITNVAPVWDVDVCDVIQDKLLGWQAKTQLNTANRPTLEDQQVYFPGTDVFAGWKIDVSPLSGPEREFFEGFFIVPFLPTSENLSAWIGEGVNEKMKALDVKVSRVDWIETPKSRATYFPNK